jgi:lysophospholipase L1-like esterase
MSARLTAKSGLQDEGAWVRKAFIMLTLGVAISAGLGEGFLTSPRSAVSAVIASVIGCALVSLVLLVVYMVLYNEGLKANKTSALVASLGFGLNLQANRAMQQVMRSTCGCVRWVMDREAQDRAAAIRRACPGRRGLCFYGDSEFTFWHHVQADMFDFSSNVIQAGFGGSRSEDLLRHQQALCLDHAPAQVIVHCAGNDWDFSSGTADPEAVAANLVRLFEELHQHVDQVGLLLTPRRPIYPDNKWQYMSSVASSVQQQLTRARARVTVFDIRDLEHPLDDFHLDRVHLNTQGHKRKAVRLCKLLQAEWGKPS